MIFTGKKCDSESELNAIELAIYGDVSPGSLQSMVEANKKLFTPWFFYKRIFFTIISKFKSKYYDFNEKIRRYNNKFLLI